MAIATTPSAARILIVDDQPANIRLVHQILCDEYATFAATSGDQALALCAATPPDLVLLDVNMPGLDGLQTCRRLKADPTMRSVPVIFVTGSHSLADENACWKAGAVDFVSKPINPTTLRNRVRAHVTLKQQADLLRQLAFSDQLTGLANRRHFNDRAAIEWRRAQRNGTPLSMVMLDVDYFKRYNDHYGHPSGDSCLAAIGAALRAVATRPDDLAARFGGEEFIILLPATSQAGALKIAQAACEAIASLAIAHAGSDAAPVVSASAGVATVLRVVATMAVDELIGLADAQLYSSKRAGRARVSAATLTPESVSS